jgi:hypothetical protein
MRKIDNHKDYNKECSAYIAVLSSFQQLIHQASSTKR